MERVQTMNPFARRESHDKRSLLAYRILTLSTWLLVFALSVYYAFNAPSNGRTLWDQSKAHPTAFSLNPEIVSVYWYAPVQDLQPELRNLKPLTIHGTRTLLLLLQLGYIYFLSAFNAVIVNAAANVGSHFILNNLLQSAFILLWVKSRFWIAEVLLVVNLFNLTSLYFRHLKTPFFVHYPVVTGPLCFAFMAMFFNGAVMVGSNSFAARICGNVAVWWVLFYGLFFLLAFKDCAVGWELSVLSLALAVQQFGVQVVALQWVFAIVITAVLLLVTLAFTIPPLFGRELVLFREVEDSESVDSEGQPLLNDD